MVSRSRLMVRFCLVLVFESGIVRSSSRNIRVARILREVNLRSPCSMLTKPRWLLHLEGASIFALALVLYRAGHFHWWLFALLLLTPDLFMLGYVANPKLGSAVYNLVHTSALPILSLGVAIVAP